ncbi:MAG TPA: ferritin family protein, partial [Chthoniobacterales bacterium]
MAKRFTDLSEREILALAISLEEEDSRIYADFADRLKESYPSTAEMLRAMTLEEREHARKLTACFRENFGEHVPLIRRGDVRNFIQRKPIWLLHSLSLEQIRREVHSMENESQRFYRHAAERASGAPVQNLLESLAQEEDNHLALAEKFTGKLEASGAVKREAETERRTFVLQVIQPGLAGLMDGSVSTLAPVFAAAFATRDSWDAFIVGMAASIGAGISMGFAE